MITVFSNKHRLRNTKTELYVGLLVAPFESPSRADIVLERVRSEKLGEVIEPRDFLSIGKLIAELELPTLFVMEGGYNINELGVNVVNVLHGFEG